MARWSPIERSLREQYGPLLIGVDEVGRGPLAGPVVACAIVMPPDKRAIAGVDDSKRLTPLKRELLARRIRSEALAVALGSVSPGEIDRVNILNATVMAMQQAIERVTAKLYRHTGQQPDHILIDGNHLRKLGHTHTAVVKGDARCYNIACASIVAKVTRDRFMRFLSSHYNGYGWSDNSGYGTRAHMHAISQLGLTPHHRRTFCQNVQISLFEAQEQAANGTTRKYHSEGDIA